MPENFTRIGCFFDLTGGRVWIDWGEKMLYFQRFLYLF